MSMKARVIHLITKLELGGAQQNTLYTVAHLDRKRFSVALWAGDGGILNDDARKLSDVEFTIVPELVREVRPGKELAALGKLRSLLKAEVKKSAGPVIVHTHSSKAGILGRWAARLAGVPVIIHSYHGFGFNDFQRRPVKWAYIATEYLTGKITTHFIAVSRANLERAVSLHLTRPERIRLIRSGIKLDEFTPRVIYASDSDVGGSDVSRENIRRMLGLPADAFFILMVACLKPQKSPVDFVRVAAQVAKAAPAARFAVAGDGELRKAMDSAIKQEGLEGKFSMLGWRRDVPELMWAADALCLTSLWEGLPRVYPQAMAAGLPIVGTRVDGGAEAILDGDNGWLLPPHDIQGIANRILELLRDPQKAKAMGRAGRNRVAEFDIDLMVRQQEELYEELIHHL